MKLAIPKYTLAFTALSVATAVIASTAQITTNINSDRAQTARSKAQKIITQHVLSKTCWKAQTSTFKIGDEINIAGGKSPTACFKNSSQYAYAAYLNGKLQVTQVFSPYEVEVTKYIIKGEKQ